MATAAEIAAHVTGVASLSTNESALVYQWMNEGYQSACAESGCLANASYSGTWPNSSGDYTLTSLVSGYTVASIRRILSTGQGVTNYPMVQSHPARIMAKRYSQGGSVITGLPTEYAVDGLDGLMVWPAPLTTATYKIYFSRYPNELVASAPTTGQESTPSAFPAEFHYPIIENYALYKAFLHRGNSVRAKEYYGMYQEAVGRLIERVNEMAGDSPAPVRVGRGRSRNRYPDVF